MQDIRPAFRIQALSGQDVGVMRAMLAMFGEAFEGRATYIRKLNLMTQIACTRSWGFAKMYFTSTFFPLRAASDP
jgi:hypothetical protein